VESLPEYKFPVADLVDIQDVLNLNFNIRPYPEAFAELNQLRKEDYFWLNYNKDLGIVAQKLPREFKKIIFTGHLGCGKTFELYRLYQELHQKGRFLCVYIDGETDTRRGEFEWEDFFVLIVKSLAHQIQNRSKEQFHALPMSGFLRKKYEKKSVNFFRKNRSEMVLYFGNFCPILPILN
jgi:hypothetical protein